MDNIKHVKVDEKLFSVPESWLDDENLWSREFTQTTINHLTKRLEQLQELLKSKEQ